MNTAAPVVSTTTGIPSLPTDNSSTTNIPGVSPMVPAPLDTATDDSASVLTSPSSAITALIPNPNTLSFTGFTGAPVYIVPMADSSISELSIETPEQQATNAPVTPRMSLSPVIPNPINAPVSFQTNSSAVAAQNNQPATVNPTQHIGQSRETELQKPVKPQLGPQPDEPMPGIDVVVPPQAPKPADVGSGKTNQPEAEHPKTEQPKIEQPKTDHPTDGMKRPQAPPVQDTQPMWWLPAVPLPVSIPPVAEHQVEPDAPGARVALILPKSSDGEVIPALFGAVGVTGGVHLAMAESRRFGVHWLPSRVASSRSARPRVGGVGPRTGRSASTIAKSVLSRSPVQRTPITASNAGFAAPSRSNNRGYSLCRHGNAFNQLRPSCRSQKVTRPIDSDRLRNSRNSSA